MLLKNTLNNILHLFTALAVPIVFAFAHLNPPKLVLLSLILT